jgi:hypothetical protein
MEKLYIARDVVNTSFAHDAWVFGGYVRDVIVCNESEFNDIDICCPKNVNPLWIVRSLSTKYKVEKCDVQTPYIGIGIKYIISYIINNILSVQFIVYDGDFNDWVDDHFSDMSCNLFYQSRTVQLGIVYVPEQFRLCQNPIDDIIKLTKSKVFDRISDPGPSFQARILLRRMRNMIIHRGWTCRNDILGETMDVCEDNYMKGIASSIDDYQSERQRNALECLPPYLRPDYQ